MVEQYIFFQRRVKRLMKDIAANRPGASGYTKAKENKNCTSRYKHSALRQKYTVFEIFLAFFKPR